MLINPQQIIDAGNYKGPASVQPNAIDFDIKTVMRIIPTNGVEGREFFLNQDLKQHQQMKPLEPQLIMCPLTKVQVPYFCFGPRTSYDVTSSAYVEVPENTAAMLIVRSTLNRNGLFLTSGLYDSGFKGNVAGILHNMSDDWAYITPGSFIGQIMFIKSDAVGTYAGGYNTTSGQHWSESIIK